MAHTTLESLFSDIADSIRLKKGTSAGIAADNFPSEIDSIQTELPSQEKEVTASTSSVEVTPDEGYALSKVTINPTPSQTKSVDVSESTQTITPDSGKLLSSVSVGAISTTYVGSGITRRDSSSLSASGATVSVPAGYYASAASKAVASGSATTPATTKAQSTPSISVNSSGLITASVAATSVSVTPTVSAGYVSSGTAGTITMSASSATKQLSTKGATTISPSTSSQTAVSAGTYCTGAITVSAISPQRSAGTSATNAGVDSTGPYVYFPYGWWPQASSSYGNYTRLTTTQRNALCSGAKSITSNGNSQSVAGYSTVNVSVPNSNSGTYTPTSRSSSIDMGSTNSYRYVNTNSVPNSNSSTYSVTRIVNQTIDLGSTNSYRYLNVKGWDYDSSAPSSGSSTRTMKASWNSTGASFYYASWTSASNFRVRFVMFTNLNGRSHGYIDFSANRCYHNVDDSHCDWGIADASWASSVDTTNGCLPPGGTIYIPANFSGATFKVIYGGYYI